MPLPAEPVVASGPVRWWAMEVAEVERELQVDPTRGLFEERVASRLEQFGANELASHAAPSFLRRFGAQFTDPLVGLLLAAIFISLIAWSISRDTSVPVEAIVIAIIVLTNAVIGVWQQERATRAVDALRQLTAAQSTVVRDGRTARIPTTSLVPGDVVLLAEGDTIGFDGRLVEAASIEANEALLTGESVPVAKVCTVQPVDAAVAERTNMVLSGTAVVRGRGRAVVVATGQLTEVGRIATLLDETANEPTPLQRQVQQLGRTLGLVVMGLAVLVVAAIFVTSDIDTAEEALDALLVAVSLAVAAVPEGLPAIMTVVLALGVQRMSRRHAIVKRLLSVETLGSASVICTDKTGTLTRNEMTVVRTATLGGSATLTGVGYAPVGELVTDVGGDDVHRMIHAEAVELIRAASVACDATLEGHDDEWAVRPAAFDEDAETELTWLGLVGIADPPRTEAAEVIVRARSAGIRTMMLTGDHPRTAAAIGASLGLERTAAPVTGDRLEHLDWTDPVEVAATIDSSDVFARVTPENKLELIRALQEAGHVVAMTGDGVNDAPALRRADIGVAMGGVGTDVAREAADMVLADDDFATIVTAIEEGRNIFADIRKFLRYLLASNAGEVLVMVIGVLAAGALGLQVGDGLAVPLLATQILWINLLTDSALALALGIDPSVEDEMSLPPRQLNDPIIDAAMWVTIAVVGTVTAIAGLVALDLELAGGLLGGDGDLVSARTMLFTTVVLAQVFNAFNSRSDTVSAFEKVFENRLLWLAAAATVVLQVAVVHTSVSSTGRSRRHRSRSRSGRRVGVSRARCWLRTSSASSSCGAAVLRDGRDLVLCLDRARRGLMAV